MEVTCDQPFARVTYEPTTPVVGSIPTVHWRAVEGVHDTGRAEAVYNCRVAEYHTYFVGCDEWSFSLWAHNSCGPGGAPARVTGQIGYGSSDLSRAAQAYRRTEGVTGGRNVAVFEYRAADGSLQTIARASERGVGHAERIIARELETMGVQPSQVTRIYSELQPCVIPTEAAGCARFIRNTFPQAEVTWSLSMVRRKHQDVPGWLLCDRLLRTREGDAYDD